MLNETRLLVLGATGFVGREVVRQCEAHGVSTIRTSRSGNDRVIRFDAANPSDWLRLQRQASESEVVAILDLVAPMVNPAHRTSPIIKELEQYGERIAELSEVLKAKIVHAGTELTGEKEDSYTTFKSHVENALRRNARNLSMVRFPRLIGSELSSEFFAMKVVHSAVLRSRLELLDPHDERRYLSVRMAAQVLLANAFWKLQSPRCDLDQHTLTCTNQEFVGIVRSHLNSAKKQSINGDPLPFYNKLKIRWGPLLKCRGLALDGRGLLEVASVHDELTMMLKSACDRVRACGL